MSLLKVASKWRASTLIREHRYYTSKSITAQLKFSLLSRVEPEHFSYPVPLLGYSWSLHKQNCYCCCSNEQLDELLSFLHKTLLMYGGKFSLDMVLLFMSWASCVHIELIGLSGKVVLCSWYLQPIQVSILWAIFPDTSYWGLVCEIVFQVSNYLSKLPNASSLMFLLICLFGKLVVNISMVMLYHKWALWVW